MTFHMIIQNEFYPLPKDVQIIQDFGDISVRLDNGEFVRGKHAIVSCNQKSVIDWLGKYPGFLKGEGAPFMQKFQVVHIKNELIKS